VLRYSRSSQETGIAKGEYARVTRVDAPNNRLTVERKDGTEQSYDPRRQQGVSVYREQERAFSVGDRVQLTAPSPDLKLANRELGTVEAIGQDGRMSLKMDGGREVELDSAKNPHLDHGYAVTSHSSQGQTADRVLIHADTELGAKDLLNNRMAYVAVSRGAYDAQIFTNDREKLGAALGHDVSHTSAHVPEMKPEQKQAVEPRREIAPKQEQGQSLDIGLGL
jgi:ATP-dependent exoDNAse (exonuclease V) alpha subunit